MNGRRRSSNVSGAVVDESKDLGVVVFEVLDCAPHKTKIHLTSAVHDPVSIRIMAESSPPFKQRSHFSEGRQEASGFRLTTS